MNRKQAHTTEKFVWFNRARYTDWTHLFTLEQIAWLLSHKHIVVDRPMTYLGENVNHLYYKFTTKGKYWHYWYEMGPKKFFQKVVLRKIVY